MIDKEKNRLKNQRYYQRHKKIIAEKAKKYYMENKDKIVAKQNEYYEEHKEEIQKYKREYYKNRAKTDLKFNINRRMRTAVYETLRYKKNGRKWEKLVRYTFDELFNRLKKTIPKGYTWQDYLEGKLQIDHIIPVSVHNFSSEKHIDFKRCWALKNLRLLPTKENQLKGKKLLNPFQQAFVMQSS